MIRDGWYRSKPDLPAQAFVEFIKAKYPQVAREIPHILVSLSRPQFSEKQVIMRYEQGRADFYTDG